ncbi:MAG: hypothetical protein NDJ89_01110 [Oligoflexia bacterium]|nr:hypothetical protein [Oligoflexia bacterium]
MASEKSRVVCVLFPAATGAKSLRAFAEASLRFTPLVALRTEERAVFLEISACGRLYTEDGLRARLLALARRLAPSAGPGAPCRVVIARDAATALALARFDPRCGADPEAWRALPLQALRGFAGAGPDTSGTASQDHEKSVERIISLLKVLGIRNLGEFALLPSASLAARLGKEAIELSARVQGKLPQAWEGFHPEPAIIERAQESAENLEAILFVLKGVLDRAMARLRGRGERVLALEARLELESWSVAAEAWRRAFGIVFPLPQGSAAGIIPILRDRLAHELARAPLGAPVEALEVEIRETAPGRGAQRDFFSKKEEEDEAVESLMARLAQKFGERNVFVARPVDRYLPEKAYERTLQVASVTDAGEGSVRALPSPERPTRLLGAPERLVARGNLLQLPLNGKHWRIRGWEGPERLSGEWWKEGFDRDYYRVATENGERLWIFQERGRDEAPLYLHGFFD